VIKNFIKLILGAIYKRFYLCTYINKKKITVFLFHEITNNPSQFQREFKLYHSLKEFKKIIKWISKNYKIISPDNLHKITTRSALITFDDGFHGSFKFAVPYLIKKKIHSIHFINMSPIINKSVNIVAYSNFMKKNSFLFNNLLKKNNIFKDCHLGITPNLYEKSKKFFFNKKNLLQYQGKLADLSLIKKYIKSSYVFIGNHLYDHWNALALKKNYFIKEYNKNNLFIKKYLNIQTKFFAFTHGVPYLNFNNSHLKYILSKKNVVNFYSSGGDNVFKNQKLFNRISINFKDINENLIYYKLLRSFFFNKLINEK
jgi:hypothetical protein